MRGRLLALLALGAALPASTQRTFREPTMEERPVVERRLVCPQGYELMQLSKPYDWSSGTVLQFSGSTILTPAYTASGSMSTQYENGERWQQGAAPKINEHVCVAKGTQGSKPDLEGDGTENEGPN